MICRLCLCDLDDTASVFIFSDTDYSLPKVIAKYLQIEVTINDNISSKLCTLCWRYLTEFEQFCSMVADKQQMLMLKTEPEPPPEPAVIVWNTESPIETKLSFDEDVKDHILCEPEIDVHQRNHTTSDSGSGSSNDDDEVERGDAFGEELQLEQHTTTPRQTKGRTRGKAAATSKGAAYRNCEPAAPVLSPAAMRESRARLRELRRNAAAGTTALVAPASLPAPSPASIEVKSEPAVAVTVTKPTTKRPLKRGRPKSSKTSSIKPKRVKPDASQLQAKRSSIKEMDDYIASNVELSCCLCTEPLQDFMELKRHFRLAHNCTGYVQCCNNRYKKRTLYVDHLHYHKDPEYFSCKPCRKRFLNRNSQDMHMLRFHSDQEELVHQCAICQARFAKKFLLTMHIKGHKGTERPEVCETCSKTFRTKLELTAHVKRMHTADFTPIICDVCGANFRSKANFLIHKKALHPVGPVAEVQCNLCSRWLRDERSLRKHLARHDDREGNNKYRCKLCSAEKSSRVALSSHMRYHHSNKRHGCTLCGKEFKLSRALAEHMATHTGIDLYSCQFCARTFKSHANMHNHKKKMHPNEWVRKYTQPSAVVPTEVDGDGEEPAELQGVVAEAIVAAQDAAY